MRKNDPNQIWFLTALWYELISYNHGHRTFGYYRGFNAALQAVKENRCNMHERLYSYLVMERIGEGVHSTCDDEQWFHWSGRKWSPCRKPKALIGFTNWALG